MYHIEVQRNFHSYGLEVFIWESTPIKKYFRIYFSEEDGHMMREEYEERTIRKPTFVIQLDEAVEFLPKLIDALSEKSQPTDNDFKIKGTLEATREHLKDIRYLLKLPEKIGDKK